jgi:hypothetical protein
MMYFPAVDFSNKEFEKTLTDFYKSDEWMNLRNDFKSKMSQFCPVCGSEEKLIVDHINPIRFFWEQRLEENNLQMLCSECNLEKGYGIGWSLQWHIDSKKRFAKKKEMDRFRYFEPKKKRNIVQEDEVPPVKIKSTESSKKIRIVKKDGTIIERTI